MKSASTLGTAIAALVFGAGLGAKSPDAGLARPYVIAADRVSDAVPQGRSLVSTLGGTIAGEEAAIPLNLYIVQLRDPSVASYTGGTAGFQPAPRLASRGGRLDARSPQAQQYAAHLRARQDAFIEDLSQRLGTPVHALESYQFALNAVVLKLDAEQVSKVRANDQVRLVDRVVAQPLHTDVGPEFIGAEGIWDGSDTGGAPATRGEGVVVGILDSGVNWSNASFAGTDGDGFTHTNPLGAGNYLGACDSETPDPVAGPNCNDKVIGAWAKSFDFVQQVNFECANPDDPDNELDLDPATCASLGVPLLDLPNALDENGHGSHTASTAAGNRHDIVYRGNPLTIKGVAPRANLVIYDVCHTRPSTGQGSCFNFASIGAVEQVIEDNIVDVINFSIGGGSQPWTDTVSQAFFAATEAGVLVVAAAGNSGPTAGSTSHVEPWVATVANGTHSRAPYNYKLSITGPGTPTPNVVNQIVFLGTAGGLHDADIPGTTPLVVSPGINGTTDGCAAFPGGTFAGAVAMVRRGTCSFGIKAANAEAAGAIAVVIANNQAGEIAPAPDPLATPTVPVFGANQVLSNAMRDYALANPGTTIAIPLGAPFTATQGDVMNVSSSRGPSTFDELKPDIMAPGTNILAAYEGAADSYEELTGTSMASPHITGSAALIRAVHPTWTAAEVKSALMLTSKSSGLVKENGTTPADPFDRGAGRVDLSVAARAGLVMDEDPANMDAANPALGGDLTTLNLANLNSRECIGSCTWTRTFRNASAVSTTYESSFSSATGVTMTVTPAQFTLAPDQEITLTIEADVSAATFGQWNFGELVLQPVAPNYSESAPAGVVPIPDGEYIGGFNDATTGCKVVDTTGDVPPGSLVTGVEIVATMTHSWIGDTVAKLASPAGTILGVFSRPGENEPDDDGSTDVVGDGSDFAANAPLTFRDGAATSAEAMGAAPMTSAQAVCRDGGPCEFAPAPGAIAQPPATFAGFAGENAEGVWRFCVGDSFPEDPGTLVDLSLKVSFGAAPTAPASHLPLAVFAVQAAPVISVDPTSIDESVLAGSAAIVVPLTIDNAGTVDLNWSEQTAAGSETLWDQPVASTNGIVSDFSTTQGGGAYTADDFVLGTSASIDMISAYGFDNTDTLADQPEITWMIFPDDGGIPDGDPETSPGSAVWSFSAAPDATGVDITDGNIVLDLAAAGETLDLPAGTYWLTVFPTYTNNVTGQTDPRWNIFQGEAAGAAAHLISPSPTMFDVPDWTPLPDLGLTFSDVAFTIDGTPSCGAAWLSVDPTSDTIGPNDSQDVDVTLDPTGLAAGVYETNLCIASNDTANPVVAVPVTFEVTSAATDPTAVGAATPDEVAAGSDTLLTVTVTPGANPASTGIAVTADLTAIGGSATQAFVDNGTGGDATAGDNVFSYTATVDAGTAPAALSLDASVTDAQSRTATATIDLTVLAAPTDPSGVGSAAPDPVPAGETTLVTVTVTPGANPPSTGIAVTADLTAIGGSATQALVDDGTGGDATAGDGIYSFEASIPAGTTAGVKALTAEITDAEARDADVAFTVEVTAPLGVAIFADGFED